MRAIRLTSLYVVSVVACGFAFGACGSEDGKKSAMYAGSGAGGEPANDAGQPAETTPTAGKSNGGEPSASGGMSGAAGAGEASPSGGGEGGASPVSCPAGFGDCDDDPSDCETPLDSAEHCGECTRDCTAAGAGAACANGLCSVLAVATNGSSYESIISGGAEFMMRVSSVPVGYFTLVRVPLDGSAEKVIWAGNGGVGLGVLYADATDLYWSINGTPASVVKKAFTAPSADAATQLFQPPHSPVFLTVQGDSFYWMTSGPYNTSTIFKRPLVTQQVDNGTEIMTVDQKNVTAFALTTDRVYWIARGAGNAHLSYVPLAGGAPADVPDAVVVDSTPLYALGDTIYFARTGQASPLNGVYKYKAGDTTVTQLTAAESVNTLIADETGATYYRATFIDGSIHKVPPQGGAAVTIAKVPGFAGFAGQDANLIYTFYNWGSAGSAYKIVK